LDGELKFRFLTLLSFLPLEETVGWDNAAGKGERLLPEVHIGNAFCASIEEELAIVSFEAPPHEHDLPFTSAVDSDDWLHGTRSNVIFGPEVEFFQVGTRCKQLCDPLFVGMSSVPAAHILRITSQKLLALILHNLASAAAHLSVQDTLTGRPQRRRI
jgi:hypothetical protein